MIVNFLYAIIFLGSLFGSELSAKNTEPTSPSKVMKILILGDSLTAGYGVEKDESFPIILESKLKAKGIKDIEVLPSGISGSTSASGPSRIQWLLKTKPDLLLLELGANDGLRGVDVKSTKENLKKTIAIAKSEKIKVILVAMQIPANYGESYRKEFESIFPQIASEEKIPMVPFFFSDSLKKDQKLLLADGLHPNAAGHKIIAEKLADFLKPLL